MFGQVIIDTQNVFALVHEVFAHGYAGIRSQILQRCRLCCGSCHNDRIIFRAIFFQRTGQAGNSGSLLSDRHINTDNAGILLVDNGIDSHGRFTGTAVADDQLTLSASNGNQCVDRFDTRLQRHVYRLTICNTGALRFNRAGRRIMDLTLPVNGLPQRIYNTPQQAFADRHFHQAARTTQDIAFANGGFTAH